MIKRIMTQGVSCPSGRPHHGESSSLVDFGPNFADLSRVTETESEKEVSRTNVELLGKANSSLRHRENISLLQMNNRLIPDV